MIKKLAVIFTVLSVAVLFIGGVTIPDSTPVPGTESGNCYIVQTSYADEGDTFTVDVVLADNPGLKSLGCSIRFSYEELEYVSVSDSGLLEGFYSSNIGSSIQLVWTGAGDENTEVNGIIATITFRVLNIPENGSLIYNTVTARTAKNITVHINGITAVVFSASQRPGSLPGITDNTDIPQIDITEEETEVLPDETEEAVTTTEQTTESAVTTTAPTTASRATTTTVASATKTVTTKPVTTPAPVTTTEPQTTTEQQTTTEPETTPVSETTPEPSEQSETSTELTTTEASSENQTVSSRDTFADAYDEETGESAANSGTLLIAGIVIALTIVISLVIYTQRR